jgi:hypothetical protein
MKLKKDKEENKLNNEIKIFKNDNNNNNNNINNNFNEYSDYFINLLNEKMIFLNGNITYANPAFDYLFSFPDINNTNLNYIKIERLVEIFDPINEIWEPLILRGNKLNYFIKTKIKIKIKFILYFTIL